MGFRNTPPRIGTSSLVSAFCCAALLAVLPLSASAQVGFDFGINDQGAFGLRNSSVSSVTLNSFTVTFTAPNQTFFDTAPTSPGNVSTGFNTFFNTGVTTVTLPGNAATDGSQTATFTFSGFDPGDLAGISFDLDVFGLSETTGTPAGGLVAALFSNGQTASGIIGSAPFTVPGLGDWDRGVSVTLATPNPIPEPGAYVSGAFFVGALGFEVLRGRRRPRRA